MFRAVISKGPPAPASESGLLKIACEDSWGGVEGRLDAVRPGRRYIVSVQAILKKFKRLKVVMF